MAYFVYKIIPVGASLVKNLEKLAEFESFKEAKVFAREKRAEIDDETVTVKVIFAKNMLEAEERLLEKREAPILKEWEK